MRNVSNKVSLKPRANNIEVVSPCVWYPMHTPSATVFEDYMGNGPDFALTAAATADALGRYAPTAPNTTIYAESGADAYLHSLLSLATIADTDQLLIAGVYQSSNASVGAPTHIFQAGDNKATGGLGSLVIYTGTTEAITVGHRGAGDSVLATVNALTGNPLQVNDTPVAFCLDIRRTTATEVEVTCYAQRGGASASVMNGTETLGIVGDGSKPSFGASAPSGYRFGARFNGVATYDQMLNGTAGDGGSLRDMLMMRRASRTEGLGALVASQLLMYPREFPTCLRDK